jgi:hypothetical protein
MNFTFILLHWKTQLVEKVTCLYTKPSEVIPHRTRSSGKNYKYPLALL